MAKDTDWPGNVTKVRELGSQRGGHGGMEEFQHEVNAYLAMGWRILNTYTEDKSHKSREECMVLLGWPHNEEARYPAGYQPAGAYRD